MYFHQILVRSLLRNEVRQQSNGNGQHQAEYLHSKFHESVYHCHMFQLVPSALYEHQ